MQKSDEVKRFEADINANKELRVRFTDECKRLAESGDYTNDAEVSCAAAVALGYGLTQADFERQSASMEQIDDDALDDVAGGSNSFSDLFSCVKDYECFTLYETDDFEDENDHNGWCVTAWHCGTAMLHTESASKNQFCWKNYHCTFINK
ncbi:MAG: hypothetical protein IKG21_01550 [Atopobiaceae bacterium]|nr:hypothetical protein [Atopobiaceae bacterium]